MKGMSQTLYIVVAAIVILVAALVVIVIFAEGIGPIVDITTQKSLCTSSYSTICAATGTEPPDWHAEKTVRSGDQTVKMSCSELASCDCITTDGIHHAECSI
jgi:hypothetical protein